MRQQKLLNRRTFLNSMAALLGTAPGIAAAEPPAQSPASKFRRDPPTVTSADQVLNIQDFEPLARAALPPAHFGYIATGADDDRTVVRNHNAFSHYEIRAHRFSELSHLTTATQVFGAEWSTPIYLSAMSAMRAFNPDGEIAAASAAASRSVQMMLSTGTSLPIEAVVAARGGAVWQQLYPTDDWSVTTGIIRHAGVAGCHDVVLTADSRGARNNETLKRAMLADNRHCTDCHVGNSHDMWRRGPMFAGLDVSRVTTLVPPNLSPAFLDKLRAEVKGRGYGRLQSTGPRRNCRRTGAPASVGTGRVRPLRRRSSDRHPQPRACSHHATSWHADNRGYPALTRGSIVRQLRVRVRHRSPNVPGWLRPSR